MLVKCNRKPSIIFAPIKKEGMYDGLSKVRKKHDTPMIKILIYLSLIHNTYIHTLLCTYILCVHTFKYFAASVIKYLKQASQEFLRLCSKLLNVK